MKINELTIRYDIDCKDVRGTGKICNLNFTSPKDLKNPRIYYRLDKFYHNYRSFVKSRDIYGLSGKAETVKKEKKCDSVTTNSNLTSDNWIHPN